MEYVALTAVVVVVAALALVVARRQPAEAVGAGPRAAVPAGAGGATHTFIGPETSISRSLYEPHLGRPRPPVLVGHRAIDPVEASRIVAAHPSPHRPMASQFNLPDVVLRRLRSPDDANALVEALLEASGLDVHRRGDVLLVSDRAVVVVDAPVGEPIDEAEMTAAYLHFRRSGASVGILVTPGLVSAAEAHRREAADPTFLHAGLDGIRRMAEAVAAGEDPINAAPGQYGSVRD